MAPGQHYNQQNENIEKYCNKLRNSAISISFLYDWDPQHEHTQGLGQDPSNLSLGKAVS